MKVHFLETPYNPGVAAAQAWLQNISRQFDGKIASETEFLSNAFTNFREINSLVTLSLLTKTVDLTEKMLICNRVFDEFWSL